MELLSTDNTAKAIVDFFSRLKLSRTRVIFTDCCITLTEGTLSRAATLILLMTTTKPVFLPDLELDKATQK